jgi:hypothetical protein
MAKFTEIVVHFTSGGEERRAVIKPKNDVRAIFLDNSHLGLKPSIDPQAQRPPATAVRLEDKDGNVVAMTNEDDGPQVCYLVGGQLFCW